MTAGESEPFPRRIVMISGAPGAGKTTIARPLARALGMPLFAKDSIKERIHDVLADTGPVETWWSRRLGAAPKELVMQRFRDRSAAGERHAVHPDQALPPERWEQDFHAPVGIGHVLMVDTSTPVDVPRVAAEVRALLC